MGLPAYGNLDLAAGDQREIAGAGCSVVIEATRLELQQDGGLRTSTEPVRFLE